MPRLPASFCLLGAAVVSACAVSAEPPPGVSRMPARVAPAANNGVEVRGGEVPVETIDKVKADLAKLRDTSAAAVKLVSAESVIWPNGALGCAKPGQMYTQATVPGYRVELELNGRRYAYHAAERGYFTLCEETNRQGLGRDSAK
jgi:hypothetical protein